MEKVKAYQTYYDGIETLFALYQNGIIKTCTRKYSSSFRQKGDKWTTTNKISKEAEYIGQYSI
jgi:hypothetical protein